MNVIDEVLTILKYISIAHHVKGRIRLKANLSIINEPLFKKAGKGSLSEKKIDEIGASLPGVIDSRVNLGARSIVIRYDPAVISPDEFEKLIESNDESIKKNILKKYKIDQLHEEVADV